MVLIFPNRDIFTILLILKKILYLNLGSKLIQKMSAFELWPPFTELLFNCFWSTYSNKKQRLIVGHKIKQTPIIVFEFSHIFLTYASMIIFGSNHGISTYIFRYRLPFRRILVNLNVKYSLFPLKWTETLCRLKSIKFFWLRFIFIFTNIQIYPKFLTNFF